MVYIIAEAGVNHNGDLNLAYKLIDIAVESKVNAIKFQTFKTENFISKKAEKAIYQKETTNSEETQFDMVKKLELSYNDFKKLYNKCNEKNIEFISSPFDIESVDFLYDLGVNIFKVGSGELTNYLLLERIAKKGKKIILSTGMSNIYEVENAINFIRKYKTCEIVLLHCVSCYPTENKDLNLNCIKTMKQKFNIDVGFSDHTIGEKASLYSVALGATYIEKHFTINKLMEGPDHRSSLDPCELNEFVKMIRDCEIIMGDGIKVCKESEINTRDVARKSLFYNNDLKKGDIIKFEDLKALRPYNGICVSNYEKIIGKKLLVDININDIIKYTDFI